MSDHHQADYTETKKIEQRLKNAVNEIHKVAPAVGDAKQVLEFASDRRKNALARHVVPLLLGNSATAAEIIARAKPEFMAEFDAIAAECREAQRVVEQGRALYAIFEAARSLNSSNREQLKQL